jgi:hypothetical protein
LRWRPRPERRAQFYERLFLRFVTDEVAWLHECWEAAGGFEGLVRFPWGKATVGRLLENVADKLLRHYGQADGSPWPTVWLR